MDPITGIGLILSLIPLFQREQDKRKATSTEDFFTWLLEHNFQNVKDCITDNYTLIEEIEKLLNENHEILLQRFNAIDEKLLRILHSVEGFRKLAKTISPAACLTLEQQKLLSVMVHSGGIKFIPVSVRQGFYFRTDNEKDIWPSDIDIKFFNASLDKLIEYGFLMYDGKSYYLTEDGHEYVNNLDKNQNRN